MPPRIPFFTLWGTALPPRTAPDARETAPPFLCNHTAAYPVAMTLDEAEALRRLFDVELDALSVTGGNCRVAQVRHSNGQHN
jgi:hypothetical protein